MDLSAGPNMRLPCATTFVQELAIADFATLQLRPLKIARGADIAGALAELQTKRLAI